MKAKVDRDKLKMQGNVSMSLYDINKGLVNQLSPCTEERIEEIKQEINDEFQNLNNEYFMLLCKELSYYTVLRKQPDETNDFKDLGTAVISLAQEMDKDIMAGDKFEGRYEIWLKDEEDSNCFILFPYDQGVVIYG